MIEKRTRNLTSVHFEIQIQMHLAFFFLLMDSEVGRGVGVAHYSKSPFLVQKIHFKIYKNPLFRVTYYVQIRVGGISNNLFF